MRKYFWKDKEGNELSFKEFISRWKKGIEGINPYQQRIAQMNSTIISMIGIILGIIMISCFYFTATWWVLIILCAGLFNSFIQYIGLKQQMMALEPIYYPDKAQKRMDKLNKKIQNK